MDDMLRMPEYFDDPWLDSIGSPDLSKDIQVAQMSLAKDLILTCIPSDAYLGISV